MYLCGRISAHGAVGHQIDLFLTPASAPQLVFQSCGMCYPIYGMVHIKDPLLLIEKSSPCSGRIRFPEWSFTICPTPYNYK